MKREPISTYTIYEGTEFCKCGAPLTPVEVLWGRKGLCETCRSAEIDNLVKNRMAPS